MVGLEAPNPSRRPTRTKLMLTRTEKANVDSPLWQREKTTHYEDHTHQRQYAVDRRDAASRSSLAAYLDNFVPTSRSARSNSVRLSQRK